MLTGERRWGSMRRGSMTVLGKVAVPKPVNLPSQRLENHGLDPDVEIVPKGTLSWGSRTCPSSENPWGNPAVVSSSVDRSESSVGHISDGFSRPSTAGSDRTWCPNSRPSSASGLLASSNSSMKSLRPRSAETRPTSSPLSRFAESVAENSVAWTDKAGREKVGSLSSHESFSLRSGDFPTLGRVRGSESSHWRGHGGGGGSLCNGSTSWDKLEASVVTSEHSGEKRMVDASRKEAVPYCIQGSNVTIDNWQCNEQRASKQNNNETRRPVHADSPNAEFYGKGAPPTTYGPMLHAAGYPFDPPDAHSYYYPPRSVVHSQASQEGAGSFYHADANACHSHMNGQHVESSPTSLPARFPGQMSACEGHHSQQFIRDTRGMRMGPRPEMYLETCGMRMKPRPEMYLNNEVPQSTYSFEMNHFNDNGQCSSQAKPEEHMALQQSCNNSQQRSYRVILKHSDRRGEPPDDEGKNCVAVALQSSCNTNQALPTSLMSSNELRSLPLSHKETSVQFINGESGHTSSLASTVSQEADKPSDGSLLKNKLVTNVTSSQGVPLENERQIIIEKKTGDLRAKTQISSDRYDRVPLVANRSAVIANFSVDDVRGSKSSGKGSGENGNDMLDPPGADRSSHISSVGKEFRDVESSLQALERDPARFSRTSRVVYGGNGYKYNGRGTVTEAEEWKRKLTDVSIAADSVDVSSRGFNESQDLVMPVARNEELESDNYENQRVIMKEIAVQKAKQLQKEEEERMRDQKAKAFAKLQELDRRTSTESPKGKIENERDQENVGEGLASKHDSEVPHEVVFMKSDSTCNAQSGKIMDADFKGINLPKRSFSEESCMDSDGLVLENDPSDIILHNQNSPVQTAMSCENKMSKHRHIDPRKKHSTSQEKIRSDELINFQNASINKMVDSQFATHSADRIAGRQKKKSINMKIKHKETVASQKGIPQISDTVSGTSSDAKFVPREKIQVDKFANSQVHGSSSKVASADAHAENQRMKNTKSKLKGVDVLQNGPQSSVVAMGDSSSILAENEERGVAPADSKASLHHIEINKFSELHAENETTDDWAQSTKEINNGSGHRPRAQVSRKILKGGQSNKLSERLHSSEAVFWSPVKSSSRQNFSEEICGDDGHKNPAPNIGSEAGNGKRSKRAEMERYVPKPVAKEHSQQLLQAKSDGANANSESNIAAAGNVEHKAEVKSGGSKISRHAKTWRQRVRLGSVVADVTKLPDQHPNLSADSHGLLSELHEQNCDNCNKDDVSTSYQVCLSTDMDNGGSKFGTDKPSNTLRTLSVHTAKFKAHVQVASHEGTETERRNGHKTSARTGYKWHPKDQVLANQSKHDSREEGWTVPVLVVQSHSDDDLTAEHEEVHLKAIPSHNISSGVSDACYPREKEVHTVDFSKNGHVIEKNVSEKVVSHHQRQKVYTSKRRTGQKNDQMIRQHEDECQDGDSHGNSRIMFPSSEKRVPRRNVHYEYQAVQSPPNSRGASKSDAQCAEDAFSVKIQESGPRYRGYDENTRRHVSYGYRKNSGSLATSSFY